MPVLSGESRAGTMTECGQRQRSKLRYSRSRKRDPAMSRRIYIEATIPSFYFEVRPDTTSQRDFGTFRPGSRSTTGTTRRRIWGRSLKTRSIRFVECAARYRRSSIMIRASWPSTTWNSRNGMERGSSLHLPRGYESPHKHGLAQNFYKDTL